MEAKRATTGVTVAAGIAALLGPACALLPYTTRFEVFPNSMLGDIWLLAAIGAIGVGIGIFALCKRSILAGTICLVANLPVLAFYGFIGLFFSTGGSR